METNKTTIKQDDYSIHHPQPKEIINKDDKNQLKRNLIKF